MTCAKVTKHFRVLRVNGSRQALLLPQRSQRRPNSRLAGLSASSTLSFGSTFSACFRSSVCVHVTLPLGKTALRQGIQKDTAWPSDRRSAIPHKTQ